MPVEAKRMTAVKASVRSVGGGMFMKQDGFNPSYILTSSGERLSRVRVLATIIDKFVAEDKRYASATIDDGTGTIRMKVFKAIGPIADVSKGDIVDAIAKIRSYNEETYIMPEAVYKVSDPNLLILRKMELEKSNGELERKRQIILENRKKTSDFDELKSLMKKKYGINPEEVEAAVLSEDMPKTTEEKEADKNSEKDMVIKLLERLDIGSGCDYFTLIKESGLAESSVEEAVNELLSDGTCFEPRPGILKLL